MERFRTCDECSRHVRPIEAKCPFCGHALEAAVLMPVPRAPAQLSRAQRIALVAAVAGGGMLAACGDDAGPETPGPRAGAGVAGQMAGASAAGSGGSAAGGGGAGKGAAGSPPIAVPVYGAPFPPPGGAGGAGGAGKSGSGGGGAGGSAGQAGSAGAGSGGAGGTAGTPAAAGSGGHMVQPLYGASPAYGVPPLPPKK
jgi:hypothetical protein